MAARTLESGSMLYVVGNGTLEALFNIPTLSISPGGLPAASLSVMASIYAKPFSLMFLIVSIVEA